MLVFVSGFLSAVRTAVMGIWGHVDDPSPHQLTWSMHTWSVSTLAKP